MIARFAAYNTKSAIRTLSEIGIVRRYFTQKTAIQADFERFLTIRKAGNRVLRVNFCTHAAGAPITVPGDNVPAYVL